MIATSILTPIISGLLTTIDLDEQITKAIVLLAFLGLAVGLGLNSPMIALQAVLPTEDVSLGGAVLTFGAGKLKSVLMGYENAVVQTLYIPLALAVLTIVGSVAMERKSIKKKQS